jgi:curli production assembly/transport component CsgG
MSKALQRRLASLALLAMLAASLAGCAVSAQDFATTPPRVTRVTFTHQERTSLPAPAGKIPVAVYNFRDQTGQYKPQENVSSFSTAVTQGGTTLLMQALKDSDWFIVNEREGLQNLITERKIARTSAKEGGPEVKLPPIEFARLILEGGVTSYETNITTGGFGARYWGLGGNVEYRQDQVTVSLRAVDVNTGRVLKAVSTSKTILSKEFDAGLFRFLTYKKLLEMETGFTNNEPAQMCVTAALEKAVIAMIIEGVKDGLWSFKNPEDNSAPLVKAYLDEAGRAKNGD